MFNHLLYIHLFRPFLKYSPATSPLPSHVSPRKLCTAAAAAISKIMRTYKRTYGLRQICNIAVYIVHSACTIHLLNLPLADVKSECALDTEGNGTDGKGKATTASQQVGKAAIRDIVHGVKHLEEIAEDWLCSRRTLSILSVLARKWKIELPEDARLVLERTDRKYGTFSTGVVSSPKESPKGEGYANMTYEGPRRSSPFGARPEEGVEFGGHGGAGMDRGRFGGTNVGDIVHGGFPDNGFVGMTQHSSPYETQLSTPTMGHQSMMTQKQQSSSPFGPNEGQFKNFTRFSPNKMSSGMQNPMQPNQLHQAQQHHLHLQQMQHQQMPQMQQPLQAFNQSQQFTQQRGFIPGHSRAVSNMSATSTPLTPNFAALTPVSRPAALFGQVEAMNANDVTSQDWWLRDQAQIAVGFDNWGGGIAANGAGLGQMAGPEIATPGLDASGQVLESGIGETYGGNGQGQDGNGNGQANGHGAGNPNSGMGGWYGL